MINKLKNNSKIKIISLLSAMVLWMYVMAIVDPEETKLFENVPVTITNKNELNEKDFVIYPEKDLTTNMYVTGKLSNLKKVTKDDIDVYGQINNPMEGNNEIYLKVSSSQRVNYDFKNPVMIVTLEKIISEDKSIKVDITGSGKNNVDNVILEDNIDKVSISGPRSLVNEVKSVVGTIKVNGKLDDFSQIIKLEPVDANGKVVEGVELKKDSVNAHITLLTQKTVPITLKLSDNSESGVNYAISQNTVTIKGKKDIVDSINNIETQPVNLSEILPGTSKDIYLQVPNGITIETKYITIKKNSEENVLSEYTYTAKDVEIRNNTENIDKSKIKIPDSINVSIEYLQSIGSINKEDIKLYIDLNELSLEDNTCKIKYESTYEIKKINIAPDTVTIEKSEV
nr:CdaR family protein [uncultured Romboutsia sp.]